MAGSIKTEPVTKEYEAGWDAVDWKQDIYEPTPHAEPAEAALVHEDSLDIEAAVAGDVDAEVEVEREATYEPAPYSCPRCGWHLKNSMDRCGNATCRLSRRS